MKVLNFNTCGNNSNEFAKVEIKRSELPENAMLYFFKGKPQKDDFPEAVNLYINEDHTGTELTDRLSNTESLLVVSLRLKELLETYLADKAQYFPASIIDRSGNVASNSYYIVHPLGTYDCFDNDQTDFFYNSETGEKIGVKKAVLSLQKLANVPAIFRTSVREQDIYIQGTEIFDKLKELKLVNVSGKRIELA